MVIAVAAFSLALHPRRRSRHGHRVGGADAPAGAESRELPRRRAGRRGPVGVASRTARRHRRRIRQLVGAAAEPIDDVRGTAAYRLHCTGGDGPPDTGLGMAGLPSAHAERGGSVTSDARDSDGQRRTACRPTMSGRARACCTCCASGSACQARRTPASRGSAGLAPSTWTACRSAPAWWPRGRRRAQHRDGRGAGERGAAASGAGGIHHGRRSPVRLLHAGPDRGRARPAEPGAQSRPTWRFARRLRATCADARAMKRSWLRSACCDQQMREHR